MLTPVCGTFIGNVSTTKKNDIDEFSQKLKTDIRKRHTALALEED